MINCIQLSTSEFAPVKIPVTHEGGLCPLENTTPASFQQSPQIPEQSKAPAHTLCLLQLLGNLWSQVFLIYVTVAKTKQKQNNNCVLKL